MQKRLQRTTNSKVYWGVKYLHPISIQINNEEIHNIKIACNLNYTEIV